MLTADLATPLPDFDACYGALRSRDRRFDGQFFAIVHTTGIFCRPSCPARTPLPHNVEFVPTAAAASQRGFRACRRCHPDAAPGSPRWNQSSDVAARAMRLINDGIIERGGVPALAAALGYSARHLSRVLTAELGAGPLALAKTQRAITARTLIEGTDLGMADVAFAAGFASVRQFNDSIRDLYACTPSAFRRGRTTARSAEVALKLPVRQPFSPSWLLWHFSAHAVAGVEETTTDAAGTTWYRRTLQLPHGPGTIALAPEPTHVRATLRLHDLRDLAVATSRIRRLLDLDADIAAINTHLQGVTGGAALVAALPGVRSLGALDGPELLLRTMIGQQVSLASAATHQSRLAQALGEPYDDPTVTHLFPTPAAIAEHGAEVLRGPRRRIAAIVDVARALAAGDLTIDYGADSTELRQRLLQQNGIGPWTADYVRLRVLGDPDVLLTSDLLISRGAERLGIDLHDTTRWAPWRSYLAMHLWHHEVTRVTNPRPDTPESSTTTTQFAIAKDTA